MVSAPLIPTITSRPLVPLMTSLAEVPTRVGSSPLQVGITTW